MRAKLREQDGVGMAEYILLTVLFCVILMIVFWKPMRRVLLGQFESTSSAIDVAGGSGSRKDAGTSGGSAAGFSSGSGSDTGSDGYSSYRFPASTDTVTR
jgi:hypothetical protein